MGRWSRARRPVGNGNGDPVAQVRRLQQALWVSAVLNMICVFAFVYVFCVPHGEPGRLELGFQAAGMGSSSLYKERSNSAAYLELRKLSTERLIHALGESALIEDGCTYRDLALAVLVSERHFDLKRALGTHPSVARQIVIAGHDSHPIQQVTVFPKLSKRHFRRITRFAQTESWPFTNEGLFVLLQESCIEDVPALRRACYSTREFLNLERILRSGGAEVRRTDQLYMLLDGTWKMLATLSDQCEKTREPDEALRRDILLSYIGAGAPAAAHLLLHMDYDWVARDLGNEEVVRILELLTDTCPEAEAFALSMLTSNRGDPVWTCAARRLYEIEDEEVPLNYDHLTALRHFAPEMALSKSVTLLKALEARSPCPENAKGGLCACVHLVVRGESLWRIANRYGVTVEALQEMNKLQSDAIHSGDILWIPQDLVESDHTLHHSKERSAKVSIGSDS